MRQGAGRMCAMFMITPITPITPVVPTPRLARSRS
jgi:hypothetical protein